MTVRALLSALALSLAFGAARAGDPEEFNPYKAAKVGDTATYKFAVKTGPINFKGDSTQTVTEKTDKELKLKVVMTLNGMEMTQAQTIDLTKPYDPTKAVANLPGSEVTVQKTDSGTEKVKVGDKSYDTTWTTYKVTGKAMGTPVEAQSKVWLSKEVPLGVVKVETTVSSSKPPTELTIELKDPTAKKP